MGRKLQHTILISILKMGLPVTIIITVGRSFELKIKIPTIHNLQVDLHYIHTHTLLPLMEHKSLNFQLSTLHKC